jgi:hypothetical protein
VRGHHTLGICHRFRPLIPRHCGGAAASHCNVPRAPALGRRATLAGPLLRPRAPNFLCRISRGRRRAPPAFAPRRAAAPAPVHGRPSGGGGGLGRLPASHTTTPPTKGAGWLCRHVFMHAWTIIFPIHCSSRAALPRAPHAPRRHRPLSGQRRPPRAVPAACSARRALAGPRRARWCALLVGTRLPPSAILATGAHIKLTHTPAAAAPPPRARPLAQQRHWAPGLCHAGARPQRGAAGTPCLCADGRTGAPAFPPPAPTCATQRPALRGRRGARALSRALLPSPWIEQQLALASIWPPPPAPRAAPPAPCGRRRVACWRVRGGRRRKQACRRADPAGPAPVFIKTQTVGITLARCSCARRRRARPRHLKAALLRPHTQQTRPVSRAIDQRCERAARVQQTGRALRALHRPPRTAWPELPAQCAGPSSPHAPPPGMGRTLPLTGRDSGRLGSCQGPPEPRDPRPWAARAPFRSATVPPRSYERAPPPPAAGAARAPRAVSPAPPLPAFCMPGASRLASLAALSPPYLFSPCPVSTLLVPERACWGAACCRPSLPHVTSAAPP